MKGFLKYILFQLTILAIPFALFAITNYGGMAVYNFFKGFSKEQLEVIYKFVRVISPFMFIAVPAVLWGFYIGFRIRRRKIIQRSEENNTFVMARLIEKEQIRRSYSDMRKNIHGFRYRGIYEYNANGETKERRILFNGFPPDEIRLYPKNENSDKFFSDTDYEKKLWFAVPLLCLATFILWLWILIPLNILDDF